MDSVDYLTGYCMCIPEYHSDSHCIHPILVPPLLAMMNKMKLDRRGVACTIAFGHKAPYIAVPMGFGLIFMGIIEIISTIMRKILAGKLLLGISQK